MRKLLSYAAGVAAACLLSTQAWAAPQVQLSASLPSPQATGTTVRLVATANDADPGTLAYRYSVAYRGDLRIGHPDSDEIAQPVARRGDDAERAVSGVDEPARRHHHALQHRS